MAVGLRFVARWKDRVPFGMDDYIVLVASVNDALTTRMNVLLIILKVFFIAFLTIPIIIGK